MKNKITGIGGGTGLSTLFRGLRKKDLEISGIISVTDDGGSSADWERDLEYSLQETLETV